MNRKLALRQVEAKKLRGAIAFLKSTGSGSGRVTANGKLVVRYYR